MNVSKNALLLFCKAPIAGMVKTRLFRENGGPLTPEQAAAFFRASILDEADLAIGALEQLEADNDAQRNADPGAPLKTYDFFVSSPACDARITKAVFDDEGGWDRSITFISDTGASFDEHFDDAFSQIYAKGYDNVVAIGGDMPLLPPGHIVDAFEWLDYLAERYDGRGFVMAPCQQAGSSIVGQTRAAFVSAQGVFYNLQGRPVVDGYLDRVREQKIPFAYLSTVLDIDNGEDLAHLISCLEAIAEASAYQPSLFFPRRVLFWIDQEMLRSKAIPDDEYDPRGRIDNVCER